MIVSVPTCSTERARFYRMHRTLANSEWTDAAQRCAYLTGWRRSEILSLQWRQVDWNGRVVRLDPGTTKNRDGRSFPFTAALERLLKDQEAERDRLKEGGTIVPLVFHRRGKVIRDFRGAWETA